MAAPLDRHRSSLEDVLDFSAEPPLPPDQRAQAEREFYNIVNHFEAIESRVPVATAVSRRYNRPVLIRLMFEYARSEESRDTFLRAFFQSMALPMDGRVNLNDKAEEEDVGTILFNFADYLMDNFFLPSK